MFSQLRLLRRFSSGFDYDVAVIGGGPGGYVSAIKAAQLGLKTACIQKRGTLGGTCLNVGCIPAKALLNSTHKYYEAKTEFKRHGIHIDNLSIDVPQMLKSKMEAVTGLTKGVQGLLKKNKVAYIKGYGKFKSLNEIEVEGQVLTAKHIVIATGSQPANLPGGILPIDQNRLLSSTGGMELTHVPQKMIVIGGGVIGLELGSVWSRLGTQVTFVEFLNRIAAGNDLEIANSLQKIMKKQGMEFHLGTKVVGGDVGEGVKIFLEGPKAPEFLEAEYALVAVGRRAFTDKLNLESIGIQTDKAGKIPVDDHCRTQHSHIYAIGDCVRGPMLAHKAEQEGFFVAELIAGQPAHINYDAIPAVVYTYPEVAMVGKTEEYLKEQNIPYNKGTFPFMANSRARANHDTDGMVKVLADKETDRILGMHIVGPNAGEIIMEGVLGMEYNASSEDLARTSTAHPGFVEAIKEACLATFAKSIHF